MYEYHVSNWKLYGPSIPHAKTAPFLAVAFRYASGRTSMGLDLEERLKAYPRLSATSSYSSSGSLYSAGMCC